jgi:hypothetical protein
MSQINQNADKLIINDDVFVPFLTEEGIQKRVNELEKRFDQL